MSKELKYITVQPDDTYYTWQVHLWLESLRNRNESDKAIVLIFIPSYREQNPKWEQVMRLYPEAEFHFYKDKDDVSSLLGIYIPVLRPYTLWRHWKEHPELSDKAIFYCDSDILFTEKFDIQQFIDDDVCYLSETTSYIGAAYFDSKVNDVLPEKLEEYKTRDVLAEIGSVIGISREEAEAKNNDSGGAQYLLKNVDAKFWSKVMNDCILIRSYLQKINKEYFENETAYAQIARTMLMARLVKAKTIRLLSSPSIALPNRISRSIRSIKAQLRSNARRFPDKQAVRPKPVINKCLAQVFQRVEFCVVWLMPPKSRAP